MRIKENEEVIVMRTSNLKSLIAGLLPVALAVSMAAGPVAHAQASDVDAAEKPSASQTQDPSVLQRHLEALALQERGDEKAAFCAFLEAGEAGYAPAQRRLAEILSKGNAAVQRDFAASMRWYRMARDQGEAIPRPHTYSAIPILR